MCFAPRKEEDKIFAREFADKLMEIFEENRGKNKIDESKWKIEKTDMGAKIEEIEE